MPSGLMPPRRSSRHRICDGPVDARIGATSHGRIYPGLIALLRQRFGDLASVIDEQLGDWTERSVLEGDSGDGAVSARKIHGQSRPRRAHDAKSQDGFREGGQIGAAWEKAEIKIEGRRHEAGAWKPQAQGVKRFL